MRGRSPRMGDRGCSHSQVRRGSQGLAKNFPAAAVRLQFGLPGFRKQLSVRRSSVSAVAPRLLLVLRLLRLFSVSSGRKHVSQFWSTLVHEVMTLTFLEHVGVEGKSKMFAAPRNITVAPWRQKANYRLWIAFLY